MALTPHESARMRAPFVPSLAEQVYQTIDGEARTVHELNWPTVRDEAYDLDLEEQMTNLRTVEKAISKARNRAEHGLRWPAKRVIVSGEDDTVLEAIDNLSDILRERVNARDLEFVSEEWGELSKTAEPQMDALGPEFGDNAPAIAEAIRSVDADALEDTYSLDANDTTYQLTEGMVEFHEEPPEDVVATEFESGEVYLDTSMDDDLRSEGYAREIIRRVQEMRKELDLELDESIRATISTDDDTLTLVEQHRQLISNEIRSSDLEFSDTIGDTEGDHDLQKTWDIKETSVKIGISQT
jgi:isoleucyl-tRNA synthetase